MGLFSKKIYKCAICGKEVTSRLPLGEFACDECMGKYKVQGYIDYRNSLTWDLPEIPFEEYVKIAENRDRILEKYRIKNGITRKEMVDAGINYKKMSQAEITEVILKMKQSVIELTIGAAYYV